MSVLSLPQVFESLTYGKEDRLAFIWNRKRQHLVANDDGTGCWSVKSIIKPGNNDVVICCVDDPMSEDNWTSVSPHDIFVITDLIRAATVEMLAKDAFCTCLLPDSDDESDDEEEVGERGCNCGGKPRARGWFVEQLVKFNKDSKDTEWHKKLVEHVKLLLPLQASIHQRLDEEGSDDDDQEEEGEQEYRKRNEDGAKLKKEEMEVQEHEEGGDGGVKRVREMEEQEEENEKGVKKFRTHNA